MSDLKHNNGARPVQKALQGAVNQYFKEQNLSKTGDIRLYRKAAIILFFHLSSYLLFFFVEAPYVWFIWAFHGLTTALVGFNIMHDGAHGSFSGNRKLNTLMAHTFNLIGSNAFYWRQKHNLNHHPYTNVAAADEDIESFGLLRMSPDNQHHWFHRFQHIYIWFLYPLTSIFWFTVLDFKAYFQQKIAGQPFSQRYDSGQSMIFWLSKINYVAMYLIIPTWLVSWETTWIGFLCLHAVMGVVFAVVFQLAHVVDKTEFPEPSPDGQLPHEWAVHQLKTTADFATSNPFVTWCLGGLNFQVEHHLYPTISHVHYPELHKRVTEVCREQGIEHKEYLTVFQAIAGHVRHLKEMGRVPG